ncbi:GTPase [Starmerella bacillaris]|uniref:GPN-loop GTPase n=1 Tax=Starmerella bacillaris TaxID=1247836 RepID=A0AAV5RNJ2_STABA|nr:GTPase [Starmerella bacillaris]
MVNVFVIGMAGSGKTTFIQRLNSELHRLKEKPYILNLDPAVHDVPYGANVDIRDSINYEKVMEEYGLGPNGAIMTSLNLFATKIDQVVDLVEKRQESHPYIIADTPGQIECFIWSASGQIITDAFATAGPTVIAYIVDTPRTTTPATFMSNMLYACSILYKTKLPMVIVFNKTDEQDAEFAKTWMTDFLVFQEALNKDGGDEEYMSSLMTSMSLVLEDFYNALDVVSVSSMTGQGFDKFLEVLDSKREEFKVNYEAERERMKKIKQEKEDAQKADSLTRLLKDVGVDKRDPLDVISDQEDDNEDDNEYVEAEPVKDITTTGLQDRYKQALGANGSVEAVDAILKGTQRSA